jgi:dipeptide/tripeptide permease
MWERCSYYGMRALLILFMVDTIQKGGLGFGDKTAGAIYGLYCASVYLAALPGGWIADRLLGSQRSVWYGGMIIAAGHFTLAVPAVETFFIGLLLVVLGTGLLKPNISVIVGELYPEGGARRDAGFSIFYMGINLGAFIGPLVCSALGEKVNWHYGFAAAGVGMLFGLLQYRLTARHLGDAGLRPRRKDRGADQGLDKGWYVVAAALAGVLLLVVLGLTRVVKFNPIILAGYATYVIVGLGAIYFAAMFAFARLDASEMKRCVVLIILLIASAMFWSGFEQAGSLLNLFAERYTRRGCFSLGWEGYFASDRDSSLGIYHVYRTTRTKLAEPFTTPVKVSEINQGPEQADPFVSDDAPTTLTMYYDGSSSGSASEWKIWQITRTSRQVPWDSTTQREVAGVNTPGAVVENNGASDVTSGGLEMYFHSRPRGPYQSWDLYKSVRASTRQDFGPAQRLTEFNTDAAEQWPCITDDGLMFFFTSDRPGGHGLRDLYVAIRKSTSEPFGPPVNLGDINSQFEDAACFYHELTRTLYFCSNRNGSWDIFASRLRRARQMPAFTPPVPVAELNTPRAEMKLWVSPELFKFIVPAGWLQSVNPVFIIAFAPVFGALWVGLARRKLNPSIPAKFAFGLVLLGLGFLVMAGASALVLSKGQVWPTWLILTYLFHTFGELCLSPVGLSAVTKLAPQRFVSQMMGLWFLATAMGNLIAGLAAGKVTESVEQMPGQFLRIVLITVGTGLVLLVLSRPIKRLIGDIR